LGIEGCSKTLGLVEDAARVLNGSAECGVGAFDAVLRLLLPVASPLAKDGVRSSGRRMTCISLGAATSDGLDGGAHGRGDADGVRVIARATLNPVARGQKGVETLNEVGVSGKELGNAVDDTRGVDSAKSLGPENQLQLEGLDLRLRFEVLHDVEELVVNVCLVMELDLDLIKVRQGVLVPKSVSHRVLSWRESRPEQGG
jgi:hypothetical protein